MGIKFSNNAYGTLNASISSSDTSLTLTSGQGARFPTLGASDYFYATLIDTSNNLEVVKCTARSTDILTITRAQESTTARAFAIGDRVELRVTAAGLVDATNATSSDYDNTSSGLTAANVQSAIDELASDLANFEAVPAGAVEYFAMSTAPSGWLKANGSTISRTTYASLFTAIGTTYGAGDGSTTFVIPDLRGEFLRGWDDSRGVDSSRTFGSSQAHAFESHGHNIRGGSGSIPDWFGGSGAAYGMLQSGGTLYGSYVQNNGGSETRPRNIALLACIKY